MIIISKNVIFPKVKLEKEEKVKTSIENLIVQVEKKKDELFEILLQHEEQDPSADDETSLTESENPTPLLRRSTRKKKTSLWFSSYVMTSNTAYYILTEDGKPPTFQESIKGPNASRQMAAMQEEMEALHRNKMQELVYYHLREKPLETNRSTKLKGMVMII